MFKKYNHNNYYNQLIPISGPFSSNDRPLCFHKICVMKACSTSLTSDTLVPMWKHCMGRTSLHVRVYNRNTWSRAYYGPCFSYLYIPNYKQLIPISGPATPAFMKTCILY